MNFRTPIDIPHTKQELTYNDHFLLLGSCFSDNIAQKLQAYAFSVVANPFGTLYNPLSIAKMIEVCTSDTTQSSPLMGGQEGGLFYSFLHHSRFSHADRAVFEQNIAASIQQGREALQKATTIIITFGTAWVYERNGEVVSNCHKLPEKEFTRRRLTVEEIVSTWQPIVEDFRAQGKRIIFTVSPIRHKRDGFHQNQLSKATLLLAIETLEKAFQQGCARSNLLTFQQGCARSNLPTFEPFYFPAYEIVLDELRDYRFFAEDMLHPSQVAVDYIWQRFSDTFFSASTRETMRLRLKEYKHSQHRPLH